MARATLTSKGQITVPKSVRDALGVSAGDRLAFRVGEDGTVTVVPETVDLRSLRGLIKPTVKGVTLEDMDTAIRKATKHQ
jgi:AbrB family looped-hinge helix DNA binding protein